MAGYHWNPGLLSHVFVLPCAVTDSHLKLAGSVQLKVLLWLSRNGGGIFNADACARAIGVSAPDCLDALHYWVEAGVLQTDDAPAAAPVPISVPSPANATLPAAHPAPVKPQMTEVIQAEKENADFSYLLREVSARFGRPLSPGDMETMLYLYRSVGLPVEVILMVVGYAAQVEHLNFRYVEKVALNWADQGIVTIAAAEERLCLLERREQALRRVRSICAIDRKTATVNEQELAEKWLYQWQVTEELLRLAYTTCIDNIGKYQPRYVDRVLAGWREDGADTPEKVAALTAPHKTSRNRRTVPKSDYDQLVEQHLPVYRKKGR